MSKDRIESELNALMAQPGMPGSKNAWDTELALMKRQTAAQIEASETQN